MKEKCLFIGDSLVGRCFLNNPLNTNPWINESIVADKNDLTIDTKCSRTTHYLKDLQLKETYNYCIIQLGICDIAPRVLFPPNMWKNEQTNPQYIKDLIKIYDLPTHLFTNVQLYTPSIRKYINENRLGLLTKYYNVNNKFLTYLEVEEVIENIEIFINNNYSNFKKCIFISPLSPHPNTINTKHHEATPSM